MVQLDTLPAYDWAPDTCESGATTSCIYDSIFTPIEAAEPTIRKSLFTHHELGVVTSHEINIQHQNVSGWFFGAIALSIFLICLFLHQKQIKIVDLIKSALDHRALDRMLRETNLTHSLDLTPIGFITMIPVSLVGYYAYLPHHDYVYIDILRYLLMFLICCAVYFARNGVIRLIGNAFNNPESVNVYVSNNYIFHLIYAIVTTSLAFFVCYTGNMGTTFLYILLSILGILLLIRITRGMLIILTLSKSSKLYLFYYLCTLEIVPILIVAKSIFYL